MILTKKSVITVLISIILLGGVLRFYRLGATSFVADEFLDINSSYAYAKTGQWQNWDFNFGRINTENAFEARDTRAWIYKWQVAQILKAGEPTEAKARLISAIWGIVSILIIFGVARYFTKKREIGLIAAFLFAISISAIIFDRRLRMYSMFLPVFLAFSWYLFRFFEEKYSGQFKFFKTIYEKIGVNAIYLIPVLLLGGASVLTHQLAANIIFVIIFYGLFWLAKNKFSFFSKYFIALAVLILGYIGATFFFPEQLATYMAGLTFFTSHFNYFIKVFADYNSIPLAVLFLAVGIYYLYKKDKLLKEASWLAASFFGILIAAVFVWNRNVGDQYIFFILPFTIILISAGIFYVAQFFVDNLKQYGKKAFYIPLALALVILPGWAYFFEEPNTYKQTSESQSANYKKIFAYFKKYKKPGDVLITRNFRNYYWAGAKIKVFDFGGELSKDKLTGEEVTTIVRDNPSGWVIISDNDEDYVSKDALNFIDKNLEKVSAPDVRGKVMVYRWENK